MDAEDDPEGPITPGPGLNVEALKYEFVDRPPRSEPGTTKPRRRGLRGEGSLRGVVMMGMGIILRMIGLIRWCWIRTLCLGERRMDLLG